MANKKQQSYIEVCKFININFPAFKLTRALTDYEAGLINAIREVFEIIVDNFFFFITLRLEKLLIFRVFRLQ